MFPIPATSRWSRRASPSRRVRARCDDPPRERVGVRARGEQIRAEPEVGAGREPERRAVPEPRLELGAAQDEPRAGRTTAAPTGATRQRPFIPRWLWTTTPPSKRRSRFLPHGVDALEHASVDRAGDERAPRVRRRRLDAIACERREPVGGPTDGITFRHAIKPRSATESALTSM